MKKIIFSTNKEVIKNVIQEAKEFIFIVSFQFTADSFVRALLLEKSKKVNLSVITLPGDSYKEESERNKINRLYEDLEKNGAKIYQSMWEVGDSTLTDTSLSGDQLEGGGNKWYSMHGKFIVTDKSALIMSANFIDNKEIEVYLQISEDDFIIKQFKEKFDKLKTLFIRDNNKLGEIIDLLDEKTKTDTKNFFAKSNRLNIKAYPPHLTPSKPISKGLHITPFDGRARDFLNTFIESAQRFLYISTERFFDDNVVKKLTSKIIKSHIKIRIITCPPNQIRQNPLKAEQMISELLSVGVEIKFFKNIHAKCWISDKFLATGSINIGKMNLGFAKTGNFWRANTETIYFDDDIGTINEAKVEFDKMYEKGEFPIKTIAEISKYIEDSKFLLKAFGMRSDKGAGETISQIYTDFKINNRKNLLQLINFAVKIAKKFDIRIITRKEVIMALVLFYLSDKKNTDYELMEKLHNITENIELNQILDFLIIKELIVKQDNYYKINVETILTGY